MHALRHPNEVDPIAYEIQPADPGWRLDADARVLPTRRPRRRLLKRMTLLLALPTAIAVSWHAGIDPLEALRGGYALSMRAVEFLSQQAPRKVATGEPRDQAQDAAPPPIQDPPRKEGEETQTPRAPQSADIREARRPEEAIAPKPQTPPPPVAPAEPAAGPSKRAAAPEPPSEDDADEAPVTAIAPPPPALTPAQKRARDAGLHTGLSPVLLERLTANDYRNAAEAIRRALAALRTDGVHVWPARPAEPGAQFSVRFVAGAPAGCRRYVVTILKDRWETTAQPLERCAQRRSASHTR